MKIGVSQVIYLNGEYHIVEKLIQDASGIAEIVTKPVRDHIIDHRLIYIDGKLSTVGDYLDESAASLIGELVRRQK